MKQNTIIIFSIMAAMYAIEGNAQKLYKWVDEHGVTHYGQDLPSQNTEHVAFEFTQDYQASNPQEDYYSIQNQLKRLQERRAEQNAQKQQSEEAKVKQKSPEVIYVNVNESERRYYAPAYFPHYKGHHFNDKYHRDYPKHSQHKRQQKTNIEKPRSGISQKSNVNRSRAVFSASR